MCRDVVSCPRNVARPLLLPERRLEHARWLEYDAGARFSEAGRLVVSRGRITSAKLRARLEREWREGKGGEGSKMKSHVLEASKNDAK